MNKAIQNLARKFQYRPDFKLDNWRIMKSEPYEGDCDDYAVTALYLHSDRSLIKFWFLLITFQAIFWFTKAPSGGGHLVLWVRGQGYIDNWANGLWRDREDFSEYKFLFPFPFPIVAIKMFFGILVRLFKNYK